MNSSKSLGALCAALLALIISSRTEAHVLLEAPQAAAGTYYKAVFRVPHGCHGNATTSLRVEIPEGITNARPMPKAGWTLTKTKGPKGPDAITWNAGNLPDDEYDEFVVFAHVSETLAAGSTVYFPAVQSCGDEAKAWTDVPQPGQTAADLKMPAPSLHILPATASAMAPMTVKAGSLEIVTPWLRATPGGAKVAGGYLRITNAGGEADRLIGAAIPIARTGDIHEMSMDNGMMRMRALDSGLEIKAGATVELKPGGYHIMFEGLTEPLKQGDMIEGTLTFAKAGKVPVTFEVGGIADTAPPAAAVEPMHMHMH